MGAEFFQKKSKILVSLTMEYFWSALTINTGFSSKILLELIGEKMGMAGFTTGITLGLAWMPTPPSSNKKG